MSVIITGGTGLLGNAFKNVMSNSFFPNRQEMNLLDSKDIENYINKCKDNNPTVFIHLAAKVGGVKANTDYVYDFYTENSTMNNSVIDACIKTNTEKLICCLSTCIYPDEKYVSYPLTEEQLHIGPPHNSNFGYAYAKRMVDKQLRAAKQQYNKNYIAIIPNNLYGEHDNFNLSSAHVMPALIRKIWEAKINNKSQFEVWGDGEIYREFTYAQDIARGVKFLLDINYDGQPLNIGCNDEYKLKDIINLICEKLDYKGEIVFDITKPKGQYRKPTSNEKFLNLGWKKEWYTPLEVGIEKTCEWFKQNYPNVRGI